MKKSLHDKYPKFENLFLKAKSQKVALQVGSNGRPKLNQLAEDVVFSTALEYTEYTEDGIVNIVDGIALLGKNVYIDEC